jgi:hypothetical protein
LRAFSATSAWPQAATLIAVSGDSDAEGDETSFLNLSNPAAGVSLADVQGQATIVNDDALPILVAIGDASSVEGDSGEMFATFTAARSGGTGAFSDRIGDGVRDRLAFDDSRIVGEVDSTDWLTTRKSVLAEFRFNGNDVYAIANHLPSKGGSGEFWQLNQDIDAGQPQNRDWDQRSEIGEDLWMLLDQIQQESGDNCLISAGDFNDFYFYRPLEAATGYVDADGVAREGGSQFDNFASD